MQDHTEASTAAPEGQGGAFVPDAPPALAFFVKDGKVTIVEENLTPLTVLTLESFAKRYFEKKAKEAFEQAAA